MTHSSCRSRSCSSKRGSRNPQCSCLRLVESANRLWALLLHAWHVACPLRCTDPNGTLLLQYGVCVSRDEAPHPQLHQCRDCTPHPNTCVSCVTHCVMRRIRQAACEQRARPPAQDCILCEGRRLMIARLDSCQVKREADDDPRSRSSRNNVIQQHKPPPHRQKFFSFRAPCPPLWWGRARWLMIAQARSRHRVYMYITHHALFTSSARIAASSCVLSLCVDSPSSLQVRVCYHCAWIRQSLIVRLCGQSL